MISQATDAKKQREEAVLLFIEAMKAGTGISSQPSIWGNGEMAANELIAGADLLMAYVLEGKKA